MLQNRTCVFYVLHLRHLLIAFFNSNRSRRNA
jgi:hypothetical protein